MTTQSPPPDLSGGVDLNSPVHQFLRSMMADTAKYRPVMAAVIMLTEDGRTIAEMMPIAQGHLTLLTVLGMLEAGHNKLKGVFIPVVPHNHDGVAQCCRNGRKATRCCDS